MIEASDASDRTMNQTVPNDSSRLLLLEELALGILRDMKLTPADRDALERAVHVARSLRRLPAGSEVKP